MVVLRVERWESVWRRSLGWNEMISLDGQVDGG